MASERSLGSEYRDDLAKELRGIDDRAERLQHLADAKVSDKYGDATSRHMLRMRDYRNESALLDIANTSPTLDALKEAIAGSPLSIRNHFSGLDHSEHLLKRIDMAKQLGDFSLLPDLGNFREKLAELQGHTNENERISYRDYLKARFQSLQLSEEEYSLIEKKLPKEIFATIDTPLEEIVLLANALPGIKTAFSCAGHAELQGDSYHGLERVYLSLDTPSNEHDDTMNHLKELLVREHGEYSASMKVTHKTTFYFQRPPSRQWMAEHGKRTPEELFVESRKRIAELLDAPELLDVSKNDFPAQVLSAQRVYMSKHPETAVTPYAPYSVLLANVKAISPSSLEAQEYKDFFIAQERSVEREELVAGIKADFQQVRQVVGVR